jgi:hypothetical protein
LIGSVRGVILGEVRPDAAAGLARGLLLQVKAGLRIGAEPLD